MQESVIKEISGEATYCLSGVPAIPLMFILMEFHAKRGYTFKQVFSIAVEQYLANPYILALTFVLEVLVFLAFCRIGKQKLILTETKLINETGLFKVERFEYPLENIEDIYVVVERDFIAKRLGCNTVSLKLKDDKGQNFPMMKNTREFVDCVCRQMALIRKKDEV